MTMPLQRRFGGVLFNGVPPRSRTLLVDSGSDGQASEARFRFDDAFEGTTAIDWSDVGGPPQSDEQNAVGWAVATLLAQFGLPNRIEVAAGLDGLAAVPLRQVMRMLYDIRCFCDERPLSGRLVLKPTGASAPRATPASTDPKKVIVVLSGGFDSTLACLLLKEAGFNVHAIHFRVNRHTEASEEEAARAVAGELGIPLRVMRISFPDQERIGRFYSRSFGEYPFYNSIPHGRDFLLAVLAAVVARRLGCGRVAFGHEKESRKKVLHYGDRPIFRHDVESQYGTERTQEFIDAALGSGVTLFSPVAGLSIYRIRRTMLTRFPDLVRHVRFCFWGHRCERCLKCASTYTMQRHLETEIIPFELNPFSDPNDEDMSLFADPDRPSEALGYGVQMHYAMLSIIDQGLADPDDIWLHRFRNQGYARVRARLDTLEKICLDIAVPPEVPVEVNQIIHSVL